MTEESEILGNIAHIPSIVCQILNIPVPEELPTLKVPDRFLGAPQLVMIVLDNFGLFEITNFQPEFLIVLYDQLILLEASSGDAESVINAILTGKETGESGIEFFHDVSRHGRSVHVIGREKNFSACNRQDVMFSPVDADAKAYTQAIRSLNRINLILVEFSDLDLTYARYADVHPPAEIVRKMLGRTSNWLKIIHKQAAKDTVFLVLGNQGTTQTKSLSYGLEGRRADWRRANIPIGLLSLKEEDPMARSSSLEQTSD